MKRYALSFAASLEHKPEHPERTARRPLQWDTEYQVWPSRAAMLKTIEMQRSGPDFAKAWKACVPRPRGGKP